MNILVTGATGFIGSNLVRRLVSQGHKLRVLVRKQSSTLNIDGLPLEIVYGDILDKGSLNNALDGCDCLYHLAAIYDFWTNRPRYVYQVNVEGTKNIMQIALKKKIKKIIYVSTIIAIGRPKSGGLADENTENEDLSKCSAYGRSKWIAEREVLKMCKEEALPAVVVNSGVPFGERDIRPTPTGYLVINFLKRRYPFYFDGIVSIVDVENVVDGLILAMEKGRIGERYIITNSQNPTLGGFYRMLEEVSGVKAPKLRMPLWFALLCGKIMNATSYATGKKPLLSVEEVKFNMYSTGYNISKAKQELNFQERPLKEALKRSVNWFQENGYLGRKDKTVKL